MKRPEEAKVMSSALNINPAFFFIDGGSAGRATVNKSATQARLLTTVQQAETLGVSQQVRNTPFSSHTGKNVPSSSLLEASGGGEEGCSH